MSGPSESQDITVDSPPPTRTNSPTASMTTGARETGEKNKEGSGGGRGRKRAAEDDAAPSAHSELKRVCNRMQNMSEQALQDMEVFSPIGDVAPLTVLEVWGMRAKVTVNGTMGVMKSVVVVDGKIVEKNIMVLDRYIDTEVPCITVYKGRRKSEKKDSRSRNTPYHLLAFGPIVKDMTQMKEKADAIRNLPKNQLEDMYSVKSLQQFAAGTCFAYTSVRFVDIPAREGENGGEPVTTLVISYEISQNGKEEKGEVYAAARLTNIFGETPVGVMVYQGQKTAAMEVTRCIVSQQSSPCKGPKTIYNRSEL